MTTTLQRRLDALFADFTVQLTALVAGARLRDLTPGQPPDAQLAQPAAPAGKARERSQDAGARAPQRRARAPEGRARRARSPEEIILGHLRDGVILTVDEALQFAPSATAGRAALESLARRGAIAFDGEEPDRFLFLGSGAASKGGAPERKAPPAQGAALDPHASPKDVEPPTGPAAAPFAPRQDDAPRASAAAAATNTGTEANAGSEADAGSQDIVATKEAPEPGRHPFVRRRKPSSQ